MYRSYKCYNPHFLDHTDRINWVGCGFLYILFNFLCDDKKLRVRMESHVNDMIYNGQSGKLSDGIPPTPAGKENIHY